MDIPREPVFELEDSVPTVTIHDFAKKNQITEEHVWDMIEEGALPARLVNDAVVIWNEVAKPKPSATMKQAPAPSNEPAVTIKNEFLPKSQLRSFHESVREHVEPEPIPFAELPASFEASDDFLIFAQDALARNTELSQQLLATKDQVIRLKDGEITELKRQIQESQLEIRRLNRQIEELETLTRFESR